MQQLPCRIAAGGHARLCAARFQRETAPARFLGIAANYSVVMSYASFMMSAVVVALASLNIASVSVAP